MGIFLVRRWAFFLGSVFCLQKGWTESPASGAAGIVERSVEQEFRIDQISPDKEVPLLEVDIPEEKLDIPDGISVHIDTISLEGNTALTQEEIETLVRPYLHRELSGKEVIALCSALNRAYVQKGYFLAWVYPPVQKIEQHHLTLEVLEGVLTDIEISGNHFYKTAYIQKYFQFLQGKALNYQSLMQALMLVNENFCLTVKGVLKKSTERGGVSLHLVVQDRYPVQLSLGYNNWGSNNTTLNQISSEFDLGNLIFQGDKLVGMTAFGVPPVFYYVNPVYSVPLNGKGTRLSLSYLYSFSNLQKYKSFELTASSEIGTVAITQPLKRTRKFDADFFSSFDIKQMNNLSKGKSYAFDRLRVLSVGASLDYIDAVKGRNFASGFFHAGIPDFLGGSHAINPQSSREGAGARYFIFNANFQRTQPLPKDCLLLFNSSPQGTLNLLPLPEQIAIGGIGTVRGYPAAVAAGDNGYYANLEFYFPPPFLKDRFVKSTGKRWKEYLQFLLFVDHGGVYTNQTVLGEASPAYLTAAGAGLRFYGPYQLNISFDAAVPLTKQYKLYSSFFYVRVNLAFF